MGGIPLFLCEPNLSNCRTTDNACSFLSKGVLYPNWYLDQLSQIITCLISLGLNPTPSPWHCLFLAAKGWIYKGPDGGDCLLIEVQVKDGSRPHYSPSNILKCPREHGFSVGLKNQGMVWCHCYAFECFSMNCSTHSNHGLPPETLFYLKLQKTAKGLCWIATNSPWKLN